MQWTISEWTIGTVISVKRLLEENIRPDAVRKYSQLPKQFRKMDVSREFSALCEDTSSKDVNKSTAANYKRFETVSEVNQTSEISALYV